MHEHIPPEMWHQYFDGRLSVEQLLALDSHMANCESCRELLAIENRITNSVADLRSDFGQLADAPTMHLSWEQLSDLVDQKLDLIDQEIAESHLNVCSNCTNELAEMRQFAAHMATFPTKEYAPPTKPLWLNKTLSFFGLGQPKKLINNLITLPTALKLAGAVALIVVIVWGGNRWWRRSSQIVQSPEIAKLETPTPATDSRTLTSTPDAIPVAPAASHLLALKVNGKQIALAASGKIEGINFVSSADESMALHALRTGKIDMPVEWPQPASSGTVLMGRSVEETFHLLKPVGIITTATSPELRWQPLNGATEYIVTVANEKTNFILTSAPLKTTHWIPAKPLTRGQTYSWQVIAIKEGKEIKSPTPDAPDAQFHILDIAQFSELSRVKKAYAGNHLMLGLVYARNGLINEAETQFKALQVANPESDIARQLLTRIRIRIRNKDD